VEFYTWLTHAFVHLCRVIIIIIIIIKIISRVKLGLGTRLLTQALVEFCWVAHL
jgi:hypothetical protein